MSFLFTACQVGAEAALKQEVARRHPDLKFSFSRPAFVTFRLPEAAVDEPPRELHSTFARTWGFSLGKVTGTNEAQMAREFWKKLEKPYPADGLTQFHHLHVWQRERLLPGDLGFDSQAAAPAAAVGARLLALRPPLAPPWPLSLNESAATGDAVLDCVLVEPGEWWFGWHRAASPETRWPGGVPNLAVPANAISRAYLKIEEALRWSELPVRPGDRCVEIGSAPGGSCQALLERGCVVTGIDPAEMDPLVLANPRFTHLRTRAKDLKRSAFSGFRWLMSDANVAPNYTLDTVEAIVTHPETHIEGLVLTLKLTDATHAAKLPLFHKRIREWGYARVRAHQLAFNREEVCVVASHRY